MRLRVLLFTTYVWSVMALAASATPITMSFTASGFQNAGTQYPGLDGPVTGSLSWDGASVNDPIAALTGINLAIAGHSYTLPEVGVINNGTSSVVGGQAHGVNAVVGDGSADDFLMTFDRVQPAITSFAYAVEGKTNAIWWTPTATTATYDPPSFFVQTLLFDLSGFANAGTPYPGFDGPLAGSLTWRSDTLHGPIDQILAFNLSIYGHTYGVGDIGVANQGTTQTAIGGLARGANAVVGDGAFDDFLFVFDRNVPSSSAFAYSIQGKSNAIWWTPSDSYLRYADVTTTPVPEPSSVALTAIGLAAARLRRRRSGVVAPRQS